ncbi:MAG: hypothetical protein LBB22_01860 [Treponema sp.]|nr:hypothetical protein [Treponema sp.]
MRYSATPQYDPLIMGVFEHKNHTHGDSPSFTRAGFTISVDSLLTKDAAFNTIV